MVGVDEQRDAEHGERQAGDDRAAEDAERAGRGGQRGHGAYAHVPLVQMEDPLSALNETSQPVELLLSVSRGDGTLGAQIEEQLRRAIRQGALRAGTPVPSTRDLARQLGVSRRVVVDAYAQLAAEGYLHLRQGARPRVRDLGRGRRARGGRAERGAGPLRLPPQRPGRLDLPAPGVAALAARRAVDDDRRRPRLRRPARGGPLRAALADYLGRVRGVVAEPSRVMVTCGYTAGPRPRVPHARPRRRDADRVRGPQLPRAEGARPARRARAGPVAVDEHGLVVGELPVVDAVVLTPAHQHPTGVVLSGERRTELLAWLRDHDAIAIDDDYDAEYRYDRAAVGALQGLDPGARRLRGSASKTLAPALRIGWLVLPSAWSRRSPTPSATSTTRPTASSSTRSPTSSSVASSTATCAACAAATARRDALIHALGEELPETAGERHRRRDCTPPSSCRTPTTRPRSSRRRGGGGSRSARWPRTGPTRTGRPPTLLLGYGQIQEAAIRPAVRARGGDPRDAGVSG